MDTAITAALTVLGVMLGLAIVEAFTTVPALSWFASGVGWIADLGRAALPRIAS